MTKTNRHKKAMLEALEKNLGIVTTACKNVGINRTTHYAWMEQDPHYAAAVSDIKEVAIDVVESELHKQIKEGSTTATIFFLKTQGKKRGYVEKQEIEQENKGEITVNITRKIIGDKS